MDAFVADVVEITRRMIRELVDAGCRYIQVDAPGYTAYVDQVSLDRMRSRGEDPRRNLERSIAADNAVIEGFDGVTFGIHLCKGNARTIDPGTGKVTPQWHREGHYDGIAEQVFSQLKHHRFSWNMTMSVPAVSRRSSMCARERSRCSGWLPPSGRIWSRSICSAAHRRGEPPSAVEQLALSPQCGFGGLDHLTIPEEDQWRKFERIMEVAERCGAKPKRVASARAWRAR